MTRDRDDALSLLDYHVLLALAEGTRYGYAITAMIEDESNGTLTPRAGTLYRVLARLMEGGLVCEADPPAGEEVHPGRARRWYALTPAGRRRLSEESLRLERIVELAHRRLGLRRS